MTTTSSSGVLWEQALEALRGEIDGDSFGAWLEPIRFQSYSEGRLVLAVPSTFHRNWVTWNYHEQIERCLEQVARQGVAIQFVVGPEESESGVDNGRDELPAVEPRNPKRSTRRLSSIELETFSLNQAYTFDSFVVGESNRFAHAAAQAVADPDSRAYNPLFVYGGVGLGKTHLMHAIGHKLLTFGSHLSVLYVSSDAFINAFIESIQRKDVAQFRNCFRTVDLLLIDDVQFFAGADKSQIEFFHTFNTLFESGRKIVISSDHPPSELIELDERLRSRFEAGLIVDIQPPDLETRAAILRRKAHDYGVELTAEIEIYVAERIKTNVRKLEGALKKLAAHNLVTGQAVTIEIARGLLSEFFSGEDPVRISVEKIQTVVSNYFDITLHDLTGRSRARKFTFPRHIASYITREITGLSFPEIARKFGGRDHTSIMHSCRKVRKSLTSDLSLQNLVKYLIKLVKGETTEGPR